MQEGFVDRVLSGASAKNAVTLNGGVAAVKGLLYAAKAVSLRSHDPFRYLVDAPLRGASAKNAVTLNGGVAAVKGLSYAAKAVSLRSHDPFRYLVDAPLRIKR